MAFDYKKEYKEFYLPKSKPEIVDIPKMRFIAVKGSGDPNEKDGEYKTALNLLYGIGFTIKMSKKGSRKIDGYFDYVMPPLEGFWWQEGKVVCGYAGNGNGGEDRRGNARMTAMAGYGGIDYSRKEDFCWISVIRLPDFVTEEDVIWAKEEAGRKKGQDFSKVEFMVIREGLCVQCMHIGTYDGEPVTIALMDQFLQENGYVNDFSPERMHHEIYLSDVRQVALEKLKTVIRHPVKRKGE